MGNARSFLLLAALFIIAVPDARSEPTTPLEAARQPDGAVVHFTGEITEVRVSDRGTVFLNFGGHFPNQVIAAVIFASRVDQFAPWREDWGQLEGKTVVIHGELQFYEGRHPRVVLHGYEQLRIVDPAQHRSR